MVQINWGLLGQPVDAGAAFRQGMETGQKRRREGEMRNALGVYAQNPTEQNLNALLPYAGPDQAFKIVEQRQRFAADRQQTQQKLDGELVKATGQAALDVLNLPEDQRSAAWDAYVDQFSARYPNAAQYRGKYTDANAKALLAQAGMMDKYQSGQNVSVVPLGNGEYVQANRRGEILGTDGNFIPVSQPTTLSQPRPAAPQPSSGGFMTFDQFNALRTAPTFRPGHPAWATPVQVDQAQYAKLPSGKTYIAPDGSVRTKN